MKLVSLLLFFLGTSSCSEVVEILEKSGDVNVVYFEECEEKIHPDLRSTRINSAIWTVDRLNILQTVLPLHLGLEIYEICDEDQYYDTIYRVFQNQRVSTTLGIVSPVHFPTRIHQFSDVLNVEAKVITRNYKHVIWTTVEILKALNWKGNVTLVVQDNRIVDEVLKQTRRGWICVGQVMEIGDFEQVSISPDVSYVIMGDGYTLNNTITKTHSLKDAKKILLVVLDGARLESVPEGNHVIQGHNEDILLDFNKTAKIVPTPILFDIAFPFVTYAVSLSIFLREQCNSSVDLFACIKLKYWFGRNIEFPPHGESELLDFLQIAPLRGKFDYEVFVSTEISSPNETYLILRKLASYNIFNEIFIEFDEDYFEKYSNNSDNANDRDCTKSGTECVANCLNFWTPKSLQQTIIRLRPEAWVFAFLAVSSLGVIFCIAILIFVISRLIKKQVFEGNPTLTMLLLFVVIIMYCSIIPFALDGDNEVKEMIFLVRSFTLALPYAAAFSLMLSRVILLATVSKEVGFMSHVAGAVQFFLTLFMFSVQCALSIQIIQKCSQVFQPIFVLYLLSYSIVLIVLLLCLSPLITKSQRNYREGKYFVISTIMIALIWCCWIPGYVMLDDFWKDPMLCIGFVATASILVGAIFIPRTYFITVSAARDKFTSALPSLAAASHTLDIYRGCAQPVYDCVNAAVVNNMVIGSENGKQRNNQAAYPNSTSTETRESQRSTGSNASTINPDKLTRF